MCDCKCTCCSNPDQALIDEYKKKRAEMMDIIDRLLARGYEFETETGSCVYYPRVINIVKEKKEIY